MKGIGMVSSLTGFGKSEVSLDDIQYSVEVRSVNNRYLEISTRLPRSLYAYENELRAVLRKRLDRGKVHLIITESRTSARQSKLSIDKEQVTRLLDSLKNVGAEIGLEDDLTLSKLIPLLDSFAPDEGDEVADNRLKIALQGVEKALDEFEKMRKEEGANLDKDMRLRLDIITETIKEIATLAEENRNTAHQKILDRIEKYVPAESVDEGRLEQEVAYLIDRIDITEEIVRLGSHIKLFIEALDKGNQVGKRLNFILQEMNREINTIGSKANDASIATYVVKCKEEAEKIREQVQNIV